MKGDHCLRARLLPSKVSLVDKPSRQPEAGEVANPAALAYLHMRRLAVADKAQTETAIGSSMSTAEDDDRKLLSLLRARDAGAFRALVDRHLPLVLGIGRRMLRDDAEAEDVAQEALLKLWQGGAALDLGAGGFRPWLRRVTTNLCIDRIRSSRRTDVTDEVPDSPVPATQLTDLAEGDMAQRVHSALMQLPDRQRQALSLFHYEGFSQIEVAGIMGVSDEAVESLLSRARRTLRGALKDEWRQLLPGEAGEA